MYKKIVYKFSEYLDGVSYFSQSPSHLSAGKPTEYR